MERELILTGIGGQGIQLASAALARAAVDEGREVQVFGSYGGMMRGGATEATVVVSDGPVEAPPTVSATWSAVLMHHDFADPTLARLRAGSVVLVNTTVVRGLELDDAWQVVEVPASDLAVGAGNIMTASMVMTGAYAAVTGLVGLESLVAASTASLPPYRTQHAALNERALRLGWSSVPAGSAPAWPVAAGVTG
jgi:Pyruvate/2-oxoacid:ferredoxin oxidoreductase gamma subunit